MIPLFRSDGQARLLAVLFDRSRSPLSIGQLSVLADSPVPTVSREVQRLADHEMVLVEQVGRTRLVTANWRLPWAGALAELLAQTFGLPGVIARALAEIAGVEDAFVFGSWAARYHGVDGRQPNDIDLLVVGDVSLDDLRVPLKPAEAIAGLYINPTLVSRSQWEDPEDPFVATVRARPMVPVPMEPRESGRASGA
ncbi:MAG: ArsR family transcriptional regulator [Actinobacteria bacterium]|nr:ArsR family transcriptional regulator [Actinomycetota bacterium]